MAWSPSRMAATKGPEVMNSRSGGYHGAGVLVFGSLVTVGEARTLLRRS